VSAIRRIEKVPERYGASAVHCVHCHVRMNGFTSLEMETEPKRFELYCTSCTVEGVGNAIKTYSAILRPIIPSALFKKRHV